MTDACRRKNEKGQSLIELLVAIGLGMVIVGSLVSLGNANTRRATQSRQENQATKLAQEGAEIVRNVRDVNWPGSVRMGNRDAGGSCSSSPYCTWDELFSDTNPQVSQSGRVDTCGGLPINQWCLRTGTETVTLAGSPSIFSRRVIIEDTLIVGGSICTDAFLPAKTPKDIKRVTVEVSWNTPTGTNTREAVTCLSPKHRQ